MWRRKGRELLGWAATTYPSMGGTGFSRVPRKGPGRRGFHGVLVSAL